MAWRPYRNLGLKLTAVGLGALLWLTVAGHEIERRVTVPLSFSNIPQPLELTGERLDAVGVYVRGDETVVSGLASGDVRVVVDLGDAEAGETLVPLEPDYVDVPFGVEVLQIEPAGVTVTLERSAQAHVVVRPTVEGTPAPGYVVSAISVEPSTVEIRGPERRTREAIAVRTARVSIDGRSTPVTTDVSVRVDDTQLRIVQPRTVRVTVQIDPAPPSEVQ